MKKIKIDLSPAERQILVYGLINWDGVPPKPAPEGLVQAMGFESLDDLIELTGQRLADSLEANLPLTGDDWRRAMMALEYSFIGRQYGAAREWRIVTGLEDDESLVLIRSIQRKLEPILLAR